MDMDISTNGTMEISMDMLTTVSYYADELCHLWLIVLYYQKGMFDFTYMYDISIIVL